MSGTSHHFFSCFEKRQNSFRIDHMSYLECKIYVMADKENLTGGSASAACLCAPRLLLRAVNWRAAAWVCDRPGSVACRFGNRRYGLEPALPLWAEADAEKLSG